MMKLYCGHAGHLPTAERWNYFVIQSAKQNHEHFFGVSNLAGLPGVWVIVGPKLFNNGEIYGVQI